MLRPRLPRPTLLVRFGLISALAIAIVGLVLVRDITSGIRGEAIGDARTIATLTGELRLAPLLHASDLQRDKPLTPATRARVAAALDGALNRTGVRRIKIWDHRGLVVFSDDPTLVGRRFDIEAELHEALGGEVASEVTQLKSTEQARDRRFGEMVEVYVPIRFGHAGRPLGAFEIYVPYRAVAARIERKARHTALLVLGGLFLLWAALFRLVAEASKRLRRQAAENAHLARHDVLTGLPNRTQFHQALGAAVEDGTATGVFVLDLDRFKEINDALGHPTGDRLLEQVGPRLRAALGPDALVARIGGDEFGVLQPGLGDEADALLVAHSLLGALAEPFALGDTTLHTEASIGIALHPAHGTQVSTLVQRADVAMYDAKHAHTGAELYTEDDDPYRATRLMLLGELPRALAEDELVLHFQPKLCLSTGRPVGAEALVRWQHPTRGLLMPADFVPLAEHTGLIHDLTLWVLERALDQCRRWRDEGLELQVAVNLSAANLLDARLPNDVARLIVAAGVPPSALALEITESVAMTDPTRAREVLGVLRSMRVALSVDDYGTGHSSLAYLGRLPVTELKIDRAFVTGLARDATSAAIVRSTVELAHNLGLKVVAEGVEDAVALERLRAEGCDLAQGFLLSRPLPGDELTRWLREQLAGPRLRLAA
jgi:diguanylate cyclase (GGDEF)-like protein